MSRTNLLAALLILTVAAAGVVDARRGVDAEIEPAPAPAFTQTNSDAWINSSPLRMDALRGKVLLLDVWTFECWNCYRSFPWLHQLQARYQDDGLQVIGIHSPEFDRERERAAVQAKVQEFGITHPVMIDNDFRYWEALGNRVWPSFYLIDKQGRVRYRFIGETQVGEPQALRIERAVNALLAEPY